MIIKREGANKPPLFYVSASLHRWEKTVHSKDGDAVHLTDDRALHLAEAAQE